MNTKPIMVLLLIFLITGSLGFVYSIDQSNRSIKGNGSFDQGNNTTTVNGTILVSPNSQDLIIVRNKTNGTNSTNVTGNGTPRIPKFNQETPSGRIPHIVDEDDGVNSVPLYAYCIEPKQKAKICESLNSAGPEQSAVIIKTIRDSNPDDKQSAINTQFKVWILVSQGNIDISQGEASDYAADMTNEQLQSNLTQAKNDLMNQYGVSENQLAGLIDYQPIDVMGNGLMTDLVAMIKNMLNLYPKINVIPNLTNNNSNSNKSNQTNQTNQTNNSKNNSNNQSSDRNPIIINNYK